jgi:hypothetical protein
MYQNPPSGCSHSGFREYVASSQTQTDVGRLGLDAGRLGLDVGRLGLDVGRLGLDASRLRTRTRGLDPAGTAA